MVSQILRACRSVHRPRVTVVRLAALFAVAGSLFYYYFCYFQVRRFEPPDSGAVYVKVTDPAQLARWREQFQTEMLDPTEYQLGKLKEVRRGYRGGRTSKDEALQRLEEIRASCFRRQKQAVSVRIPARYRKAFILALCANKDVYDSAYYLSDYIETEDSGQRDRHYEKSFMAWKSARKKLKEARLSLNDPQDP